MAERWNFFTFTTGTEKKKLIDYFVLALDFIYFLSRVVVVEEELVGGKH